MELKAINKDEKVLFSCEGKTIDCTYRSDFCEGDKIVITTEERYIKLKLDRTMCEAVLFVPSGSFEFEIPFGEKRRMYANEAFLGGEHEMSVSPAGEDAYKMRNIALNPYDMQCMTGVFPHAYANFVTRDLPCFYERNAIDGVCVSDGHGAYPYHSWAGGAREDLEYYIEFGAETEVERIVFFLRADFPHDTYWKSIDVVFSDGTVKTMNLEKTADGQTLYLDAPIVTQTIHLTNFKQAVQPLSWAALSQIEVYGRYLCI